MARIVFTEQHLTAISPALQQPLVQTALRAAIPVKQLSATTTTVADDFAPPANVTLRQRGTPVGVPLHELLAAVQAKAPTVNSMVMRNGRIYVGYTTAPDAATTRAVQAELSDATTMAALQAKYTPASDLVTLHKQLTDGTIGDGEWLAVFRRYTTQQLATPTTPISTTPTPVLTTPVLTTPVATPIVTTPTPIPTKTPEK